MQNQSQEIERKIRYFYFEDECHLLWGDICGYTWSPRDSRLELPIANERIRQSYFGVLDIVSGIVTIKSYPKVNSESMIDFLKYLLKKHPKANLTICLDKVSYHRSTLVKSFVRDVNSGLPKDKPKLKLIFLASNAPEENPIEDVWLYGKTAIRKEPIHLENFSEIKCKFENSLRHKKFTSKKLVGFRKVLQLI